MQRTNTYSFQSICVSFDSIFLTHLFRSSPMQTCRAKSAKTIRQKIVSVITSASCLKLCNNALMMVFRPERMPVQSWSRRASSPGWWESLLSFSKHGLNIEGDYLHAVHTTTDVLNVLINPTEVGSTRPTLLLCLFSTPIYCPRVVRVNRNAEVEFG